MWDSGLEGGKGWRKTYGYFEVYHLVCKGGHVVVEADAVFSDVLRGKDEVALAFFLVLHDHFVVGTDDAVVDVEGTA